MSDDPTLSYATPQPIQPSIPAQTGPIVARRGAYYRNARLILCAVVFAFGLWSAYDGFKAWPENNVKIRQTQKELSEAQSRQDRDAIARLDQQRKSLGEEHNDAALLLNRVLAFVLPVAAIAYLAYFLYRSRGELRLENDVLSVPGHPPIPLGDVRDVDTKLWKKKGIAKVTYATAGKSGAFVLDDFVYDQKPTDAIYDRLLERNATPPAPDVVVG